MVVIVTVFDPLIPLPAGPVIVIVILIWAFGNEWVIFAMRDKDTPGEMVEGEALMLTESLRPTESELLTPVANRVPFALRVATVTAISITITVIDMRRPLRSFSFPAATEPMNLVTLGVYARMLLVKDICYYETPKTFGELPIKCSWLAMRP